MSLIITKKFKRANALDAAAQDAKFKVGDRVKYTGRSALIYGKTGSVGTIKSVDTRIFADGYPLYEVEFPETRGRLTDIIGEEHLRLVNSRATDACAADAKFKIGDKVKDKTRRYMGAAKIIDETDDGYVVKFDNGQRDIIAKTDIVVVADSRATDACGTDAEFKVGDKVKLSGSHPRFPNKVGVVTHVFPTGFVKVKVDGIEDIEIAERLISKTEDAAEKGSRELQNIFYGALYALKKVADRAKVEGAQTLVDAANSAAKELTSKSYTVF